MPGILRFDPGQQRPQVGTGDVLSLPLDREQLRPGLKRMQQALGGGAVGGR